MFGTGNFNEVVNLAYESVRKAMRDIYVRVTGKAPPLPTLEALMKELTLLQARPVSALDLMDLLKAKKVGQKRQLDMEHAERSLRIAKTVICKAYQDEVMG